MTGRLVLGSHVTGALGTGREGSTKGAEVPGLGAAAASARSCQQQPSGMPDGLLREQLIEALVALIEWIAAQELPSPIRTSNAAQIVIIAKLGRPKRPHIESSTRHTAPRTHCSMGLRALRRTS
jgi:hypothetical protein